MPTPKFRTSASKRDMRRSHHALKPTGNAPCPSCGEARLSHTVCGSCGYYRGRIAIEPKANTEFTDADIEA